MILLIVLFGITLVNSHPGLHNGNSKGHRELNNLGVVNGDKSAKMLPYLCLLKEDGEHICGCSILDKDTILTAAHCYNESFKDSDYSIGVGNVDPKDQDYYTVKTFTIHENYNKGKYKFDNDVAVIKLTKSIKMITGKVAAVKLYETCDKGLPYGELALAAGWGALDEKLEKYPDVLYETKLKVLKNSDRGCIKYDEKKFLSDTMFCAGWANGISDVCGGDSGGPLVNKYNEQIGIVSWAIGCSRVDRSTVFTNICQVTDWLSKNGFKIK